MLTNAAETIFLEEDERETVYSFSDSCSTVSDTPSLAVAEASESSTASRAGAAVDRAARHKAYLTSAPFSAHTCQSAGTDEALRIQAHIRWHIRKDAAVENSQLALRARSSSASSSALELRRPTSSASFSRHTRLDSPTASITTTPWWPVRCLLPAAAVWTRRQRVVLDVGRPLLAACVFPRSSDGNAQADATRLDRGARTRSLESELEQFVLPTISRRHAQLSFLLTTLDAAETDNDDASIRPPSSSWRCDAVEVVDFVSATTYHGVPLQPHHRYYFPVHSPHAASAAVAGTSLADALGAEGAWSGAARQSHLLPSQQRSVSLGIGRWCTLEVVLDTPARPSRCVAPAAKRATASTARPSLDVDNDSPRSAVHAAHDVDAHSLSETPSEQILSFASEMEPALLVRGKGRRNGQAGPNPNARSSAVAHGKGKRAPPLPRGTEDQGAADGFIQSEESANLSQVPSRGPTKAGKKQPASTRSSTGHEPAPRKRRTTTADKPGTATDGAIPNTVVFTTGMELSASEIRRLRAAHVRVNPPLAEARRAKVLVVQAPLNRSVKLLTVIPFVEAVVSRPWLEGVMACGDVNALQTQGFAYTEPKTAKGIERTNGFELAALFRVPPADRQRLFSGLRFFVHRDATPQEPPSNDLKTVLTASGGVVCKSPEDATVVVVPSTTPTKTCWRSLTGALKPRRGREKAVFVTRDDIFKFVLRQERVSSSTVVPPVSSTTAAGQLDSESPHRRTSRPSTNRTRTSTSSRAKQSPTRRSASTRASTAK